MRNLCRYVLEIVLQYVNEQLLLYSRAGNVHKSRQFEKISVQDELYSRLQNCCKLI